MESAIALVVVGLIVALIGIYLVKVIRGLK
jgi:hypothetical protein